MHTAYSHNRKLVLLALISLVAAVLFVARPLFAQTTPPPASPNTQSVNEANGNNNDFDDDVKQGKDELKKDPEAQKLQKEVVDGEDQQAGDENDGDINEHSDIEEADNEQKACEAELVQEQQQCQNEEKAQDRKECEEKVLQEQGQCEHDNLDNSEIEEVDDSNNLDQQSQDIIDEHQQEQDREENQQGRGLENSQPGQDQPGTTSTHDGSSRE